jgi:hypothetical protein
MSWLPVSSHAIRIGRELALASVREENDLYEDKKRKTRVVKKRSSGRSSRMAVAEPAQDQ